jgi:hypothetical protein
LAETLQATKRAADRTPDPLRCPAASFHSDLSMFQKTGVAGPSSTPVSDFRHTLATRYWPSRERRQRQRGRERNGRQGKPNWEHHSARRQMQKTSARKFHGAPPGNAKNHSKSRVIERVTIFRLWPCCDVPRPEKKDRIYLRAFYR